MVPAWKTSLFRHCGVSGATTAGSEARPQANSLLKKLDKFEAIIIDDLSYIPQEREETDVLFVLLAERYERRSVVITSNLPFSKWDNIFKDPITAMAAVDRLVHHATILELNGDSYRATAASRKKIASKAAISKEE